MTDRATSPDKTKSGAHRKKSGRATETVVRVPIWNEVLELESKLVPEAVAHIKATHKPMPWIAISIGLAGSLIAIVMASVEFYRQQLIRIIMARPPISRGHIPTFLEFQAPSSISNTWEVTWQVTLQALGSAILGWLLVASVGKWRRFAKRVPWVPALVGAAIYFAIMWYVTFVLPRR